MRKEGGVWVGSKEGESMLDTFGGRRTFVMGPPIEEVVKPLAPKKGKRGPPPKNADDTGW